MLSDVREKNKVWKETRSQVLILYDPDVLVGFYFVLKHFNEIIFTDGKGGFLKRFQREW